MKHVYLINNSRGKDNKGKDGVRFEKIKLDDSKRHDIISKLYYLKYRVPTEEDIKRGDKDVKEFYKRHSIDDVKTLICRIDDMVPLFNIYHVNIYLINKDNVYYRVVYNNYRFPGSTLVRNFHKYISKLKNGDALTERKKRKINLMLNFLDQLDLKELYSSYIKVFTKYSPYIGNIITQCNRPSFVNIFSHLRPYYTRQELIKLAMNMGLKLKGDPYNPDNLDEICSKVSENDINSDILVDHQHHIVDNNAVGLIKYYTIQGSFFMNQYLRNLTSYGDKNTFMEEIIEPVWNLVLSSPKFDNDYYLYRFIDNDYFIKDLNIGDIFEEQGFMSTTRDPFYRADTYKFGFILLKIKIPKNVKGVGLCLETLSQFPSEQEIILPPKCRLKLINKNSDCTYHHIDQDYGAKIKVRYEFEWVENGPVEFNRKKKDESRHLVDFLNMDKVKTISLREKIRLFVSKYVNSMNSFDVKIGDQVFQLVGEWFNSSGAYSDFYMLDTTDGFSIYTIFDGHVLFMIELAEINEDKRMVVNYYLRYTNIIREKIIPEEDFIKLISCIANYFNIPSIIIYSDFVSCDSSPTTRNALKIQREFSKDPYNMSVKSSEDVDETSGSNFLYYGGYHSLDVYNYLKNGKKRFDNMNITKMELTPNYKYNDLDTLRTSSPEKILRKDDNDELYQIYLRNYVPSHKDKDNVADLYLWIIDHYCYLTSTLVMKIGRLYPTVNPFDTITYTLLPDMFLYNRELIRYVSDDMISSYRLKRIYNAPTDEYRDTVDRVKKAALF